MKVKSKHSNLCLNLVFNNNRLSKSKHSQISFEYLVIIGFVIFVLIGVLTMAMLYSGSIKDRIKITQMTNCANKIISTAESVFYAGEPSRATINCQLPENIREISIEENSLIISIQTSNGLMKTAFISNVPIEQGDEWLTISPGVKKIKVFVSDNIIRIERG